MRANVIAVDRTNKRIYHFLNENVNLQEREVKLVLLTHLGGQIL